MAGPNRVALGDRGRGDGGRLGGGGFAAYTGRPYWKPATSRESRCLDEARGYLRLLACIATACTEGVLFPGSVTLYSDNKGVIQVLQGLDGRKHNASRKTVGVGWWGMIRRAAAVLVARGGQWGSYWVRNHAERRRQDGEAWAAVEVGNGLADRWADNPTGKLQKSCDNNPITPVRWWTAIPATPMEELEDTLSRNILRMSTESDTAAYLWGRQKPTDTISDWRNCIRWEPAFASMTKYIQDKNRRTKYIQERGNRLSPPWFPLFFFFG
jgi:hypothetical protein